jgi:sulfate permease, SulP family
VVALALIPEAIGFSIIAGVDPRVGLYASVAIAIVISLHRRRPGMISAATAAVAVLVVPLVRDHGVEYLFAATILMGVIQIAAGLLRLDLLMQFVSRSVITGFVNALAILIFMAQLPQLTGVTWQTYAMVAAGLAIIYLLPRMTTAVPSPLVAILVLTRSASAGGCRSTPWATWASCRKACPVLRPAARAADAGNAADHPALFADDGGGRPARIAADRADRRRHDRHRQRQAPRMCRPGQRQHRRRLVGGMGGCAMIGQSVINVTSGGRGRLSTFVAGAFLLFLLAVLGPYVGQVPMPALVAVMIMVSIGTFSWNSIPNLRRHPPPSSVVMLTTVVVVVATHDLSLGVLAGVLLSGIFFAGKVQRMFAVERDDRGGRPHRDLPGEGEIFFASVDRFTRAFRSKETAPNVAST